MWCSTKTRTRPPHSIAVSAVVSEPPISQPRPKGTRKPTSTHKMNVRLTQRITGSAIRSGA